MQEASGVKRALAEGDMHLQGWFSNSTEFLKDLAVVNVPLDDADLSLDNDTSEKVLWVYWKAREDVLTFRVGNLGDVAYTRIRIAIKVASLFDPQGMTAPIIFKAKIKLR